MLAKEARTPKREVRKSVALNAAVRPIRSEPERKVRQIIL